MSADNYFENELQLNRHKINFERKKMELMRENYCRF